MQGVSAPTLVAINGGTNIRSRKCRTPPSVPVAGGKYICAASTKKSIVPTPATSKIATKAVAAMNNHSNILAYYSAMVQANIMLEKGIIDESDMVSIEDKLAQKYELEFGSILRENDLINLDFRVNMSHTKEVL